MIYTSTPGDVSLPPPGQWDWEPRWEYRESGSLGDVNHLAADGWEVCAATLTAAGQRWFLLRREVITQ